MVGLGCKLDYERADNNFQSYVDYNQPSDKDDERLHPKSFLLTPSLVRVAQGSRGNREQILTRTDASHKSREHDGSTT